MSIRELILTTGKIASVILGIIILGAGLYFHYSSTWMKKVVKHGVELRFYSLCGVSFNLDTGRPCPDIAMEKFFVVVIIACFILSTFFCLVAGFDFFKSGIGKILDIGYHVLGGLALIAAGTANILSALQIHNIMSNEASYDETIKDTSYNFWEDEKRSTGIITIAQGVFFILIAFLIFIRKTRNDTQDRFYDLPARRATALSNMDHRVPSEQLRNAYADEPPTYQQVMEYGASPPLNAQIANSNGGVVNSVSPASTQAIPTPTVSALVNQNYGFTYSIADIKE